MKKATTPPSGSAEPPELWQVARRGLFKFILERHLPWVEEKARELNLESDLYPCGPDGKLNRYGAYLVISMAQTEYWREKARRLDTEEGRARERRETARYYARVILAWIKDPDTVNPITVFQKNGVTFSGDTEDLAMLGYDWFQEWHKASELRRATGYKLSRFREHVGEIASWFPADALELINSDQTRCSCGVVLKRDGKTSLYFWPVALLMLAKVVQNAPAQRRASLAESIWLWTCKRCTANEERRIMMRDILQHFGARCE